MKTLDNFMFSAGKVFFGLAVGGLIFLALLGLAKMIAVGFLVISSVCI